ncbi:MAG: PaaI family thioesterase [Desulfohalobiaceae bacterium]
MHKHQKTRPSNMQDFFNTHDQLARHLGIRVLQASQGQALAQMEIRPEHKNGLDMVHGGAIFTLADLAFAAASNSRGRAAVAINSHISFLKPVYNGLLRAEAREVSLSHKLASYTVHIYDQEGETCAVFQGMVYRKQTTLKEQD